MAQVQIVLLIARDCLSVQPYRKKEEPGTYADQETQGPWGMIFTWVRPQISSRRLVCLGLDICGVRRWEQMLLRTPDTAARAFTNSEMQWAAAQPERLVRLWTIKEALVKALGCGFAGLAYHDIAIEFVPEGLIIQVPATVPIDIPVDIPGERSILDISWQYILFGEKNFPGALVFAWADNKPHTTDYVSKMQYDHTKETCKIVLELRRVTGMQSGTRHEKRIAERLAARQAAYSAASHLWLFHTYQLLDICQAPGGRPLLQTTENDLVTTNRMCLSLSHCSGWAAAALGSVSCKTEI